MSTSVQQRPLRIWAAALAIIFAVASAIGFAPAAYATPGITATLLLNGLPTYNGVPVVGDGDELTLRVQYNQSVGPGATVEFELDGPVDLGPAPAANEMIESFVKDGNKYTIKFRDTFTNDQGFVDFKMTVNADTSSSVEEIAWRFGDDEDSREVIVRADGDQFENVTEGLDKTRTSPSNLNSFVQTTKVDGNIVVTVDPTIATDAGGWVTYTLQVRIEDGDDVTIADQLSSFMAYEGAADFDATLTTWDSEGLNQTTSPYSFVPVISGNSFEWTGDIDAPSILNITYRARVDAAQVSALQTALQTQANALNPPAGPGYGSFSLNLDNDAEFNEYDDSARISLGGTVANPHPGPGTGDLETAFGKSASWSSQVVDAADDGTLDPVLDLTYTLRANLGFWDGREGIGTGEVNPNRVLHRNVVIEDTLPSQARWNIEDPAFITPTGNLVVGALDDADVCANAAEFASDTYSGMYCVTGQTLRINVGKTAITNAEFEVKAQLTTIAGLTEGGSTTIVGAQPYQWPNTASFHWRTAGGATNRSADVTVVDLPDTSAGIDDSSVFVKSGTPDATQVNGGDTVTVVYTFTIAENTGIDARTARILDHIDTSIFDITDPATISVSGSYAGTSLADDDFVIDVDADGNLVIELSDARKALIDDPGTGALTVRISLTTRELNAKETLEITNDATLEATGLTFDYISSDSFEVTSFGDEAEVRKRLFDPLTGEWTDVLKAYVDADGVLIQDTYAYRVEFIGHGSFGSIAILDVVDNLPAEVEFIGFVEEADAADPLSPTATLINPGPVTLDDGNLEAVYVPAEHQVIISQASGTVFDEGSRTQTYFVVRVTDPADLEQVAIENRISGTTATIEKQERPSIDIEKWTDEVEESGPVYDDGGNLLNGGDDVTPSYAGDYDEAPGRLLDTNAPVEIRFTISNDGGEPLTQITVSDQLMGGQGTITGLNCLFPDDSQGTTWDGPFLPGERFDCAGTLPGLPAGVDHYNTAAVHAVGQFSGEDVSDEDDWHAYTAAVASTGSTGLQTILWTSLLLLLAGAGLFLLTRSRSKVETAHSTLD